MHTVEVVNEVERGERLDGLGLGEEGGDGSCVIMEEVEEGVPLAGKHHGVLRAHLHW